MKARSSMTNLRSRDGGASNVPVLRLGARLLDALERPQIRRGAVVRKPQVDPGVAQVAPRDELEVVEVRKAPVALAGGLEHGDVHAGEVGGRRRQSVLPAVVGDVRGRRVQRAVVAEGDRVLDGQRRGDVGGAEVDVVAVVVSGAVADRHVAAVAVVVEAVVDVAGGDEPAVGGVLMQQALGAASGLESIAVSGAVGAALQLAVIDGPAILVGGRDVVGAAQVPVPAVVRVVPGAAPDELVDLAYVESGSAD